MPFRKFNYTRAIEVALLLVVSGLTYLPNLLQATIYRDDWYYAMDRIIGGPGVFQAMFSIDRPARGPFFEIYYQLFGVSPLPYHLTSFLWRFLGALAALWLFNLLWPKQRRAALLMALLFSLFPGYLRWMEGFEDQPRIASLCLEVLSFALTLKAISTVRTIPKIAAWVGAIVTGWAYIALVDFAMGMEIFRLLCVFIFIGQNQAYGSLIKRCVRAVQGWAIAAVVPAGFLFWKLFIFHNERPATDISRQLGVFIGSPLSTGFWWLVRLFQSAADVALFSWVTPAFQGFFGLPLRNTASGLFLALLAAASVALAHTFLSNERVDDQELAGPGKPGALADRSHLGRTDRCGDGCITRCHGQPLRRLSELFPLCPAGFTGSRGINRWIDPFTPFKQAAPLARPWRWCCSLY